MQFLKSSLILYVSQLNEMSFKEFKPLAIIWNFWCLWWVLWVLQILSKCCFLMRGNYLKGIHEIKNHTYTITFIRRMEGTIEDPSFLVVPYLQIGAQNLASPLHKFLQREHKQMQFFSFIFLPKEHKTGCRGYSTFKKSECSGIPIYAPS